MGFASTEDLDEEAITRRYRELATQRHPDRGGSEHAMQELNWARAEGLDFVREGAA